MCAEVLNKPQIKGETKLRAAVRRWNARKDFFHFNASCHRHSSLRDSAQNGLIKREARLAAAAIEPLKTISFDSTIRPVHVATAFFPFRF